MVEYVPYYSAPGVRWSLLPATRLASRKILIEQNIKRRTGPAPYVFSLLGADLFPFTPTLPVVSRDTPPTLSYTTLEMASRVFLSSKKPGIYLVKPMYTVYYV